MPLWDMVSWIVAAMSDMHLVAPMLIPLMIDAKSMELVVIDNLSLVISCR